jgi:stage IV sporulation protein FB
MLGIEEDVYVAEPRRTWLDLRLRTAGTSIRVHPLFWVVAAAMGWGFYADPDRGGLGLLGVWLVCVLLSLAVHEFGHVAAGWFCGVRLQAVLYALGSLTIGMEGIKSRGQRIAVLLAGPFAQGMLLGALWLVTSDWIPTPAFAQEPVWVAQLAANLVYMLFLFNLSWLVLSLLPIWPLDGGFIVWEVCEGLFGPRGRAAALGVCLFVSGLLTLRVGQATQALLPFRLDPRIGIDLQMYSLLLVFCALLTGSAFQALRAERKRYRVQDSAVGAGA